MGTNYQQPGQTFQFTAPTGGVVKGTPTIIGALPVVPLETAAEGALFMGQIGPAILTGLKKVGSQAWTVGAIVYYDSTNKYLTNVSTSNYRFGVALEAVGSGAGETASGAVLMHGHGVPAGA